MNKICLLEWSDSNMAGDNWSWKITLTFRKDKRYSVGAKQFIKGPYANTIPSIYPLRNGKEIKEAIDTIFQDVNLSDSYFEWHEIISAISYESPKLALEVMESLHPESALISMDEETRENKKQEQLMDKYYSDMENINSIRKFIKEVKDKK
jgi:hypothetical protein